MRTMKALLLAAVLVMSTSAAHAGTMTFGINGDAAIPLGNLSKVPDASSTSTELQAGMKVSFGGGVYGDYWIKDDYAFGLDINGEFFSNKDDLFDAATKAAYPDIKFKATVMSFGAHGIWAPAMANAPAQPWITYGAGLYRINFKTEKAPASFDIDKNLNKFGFNLGAGVDMKAGASMKVGAEVKYHYILSALDPHDFDSTVASDAKAANYVTAGIRLTFLTAGVTK